MNLKKLTIVLLVLAMLIFAVGCAKTVAPSAPAPAPVVAPEPTPAPAPEPAPVELPKEEVKEEVKPAAPASGTVKYTDAGFEPAEVKVSVGGKVVWENKGKKSMLLLEKGGLFAGKSRTTAVDGTWEFTFTKAGTFEYFNKLNSAQKGKVIVE